MIVLYEIDCMSCGWIGVALAYGSLLLALLFFWLMKKVDWTTG